MWPDFLNSYASRSKSNLGPSKNFAPRTGQHKTNGYVLQSHSRDDANFQTVIYSDLAKASGHVGDSKEHIVQGADEEAVTKCPVVETTISVHNTSWETLDVDAGSSGSRG